MQDKETPPTSLTQWLIFKVLRAFVKEPMQVGLPTPAAALADLKHTPFIL